MKIRFLYNWISLGIFHQCTKENSIRFTPAKQKFIPTATPLCRHLGKDAVTKHHLHLEHLAVVHLDDLKGINEDQPMFPHISLCFPMFPSVDEFFKKRIHCYYIDAWETRSEAPNSRLPIDLRNLSWEYMATPSSLLLSLPPFTTG